MEGLAPPLKCLIEVRSALQNGESVRTGLLRFVQSSSCEFSTQVRQFLFDYERGIDWRSRLPTIQSQYRRALLELIALGLDGESIQASLEEMNKELQIACESEIKERMDMLPLQMLFPLLLLLFPAYLLLLFGPLVSAFVREMSR